MDKKLDGRTESYRAATMYRIEPETTNQMTPNDNAKALESPEVVRSRCCGLCKSSTKTKKAQIVSPSSKPKIDVNSPITGTSK